VNLDRSRSLNGTPTLRGFLSDLETTHQRLVDECRDELIGIGLCALVLGWLTRHEYYRGVLMPLSVLVQGIELSNVQLIHDYYSALERVEQDDDETVDSDIVEFIKTMRDQHGGEDDDGSEEA